MKKLTPWRFVLGLLKPVLFLGLLSAVPDISKGLGLVEGAQAATTGLIPPTPTVPGVSTPTIAPIAQATPQIAQLGVAGLVVANMNEGRR